MRGHAHRPAILILSRAAHVEEYGAWRPSFDAARAGARVRPRMRALPEPRRDILQAWADAHRRDPYGEPGRVVGLERKSAQGRLAGRWLEAPGRNLAREAPQRLILVHAEHRIVIAAHAGIGYVRRTAG